MATPIATRTLKVVFASVLGIVLIWSTTAANAEDTAPPATVSQQTASADPTVSATPSVSSTHEKTLHSDSEETPAIAPGYSKDGCYDEDMLHLPKVANTEYELNGKRVEGVIKFRKSDKLIAFHLKDGKRIGKPTEVTRQAVSLTDTPCGADGKPLTVKEWQAQKRNRIIKWSSIFVGALLMGGAGYLLAKENRLKSTRVRHASKR